MEDFVIPSERSESRDLIDEISRLRPASLRLRRTTLEMTFWGPLAMTVVTLFVFVLPVQAAAYSAEIVEPAAKMVLTPGERGTASLLIKNTGSVTWPVTGRGYVSAYTFDPKYHLSRLEDKSWRRRDQPATIAAAVKPGASGYLRFPVLAPLEPGVYEETFQLAAEDTAWIDGGKFTLVVVVKEKGVPAAVGDSSAASRLQNDGLDPGSSQGLVRDDNSMPASTVALPHKALLLARSHRKIEAAGGENILMRFGFKNVGETTWIERGIGYADVALVGFNDPLTRALSPEGRGEFMHESWVSAREVVKLASGTVGPGQTEFFTFNVRTPAKSGAYTLRLQLTAGGQRVDGGEIEVPVTVTSDAQNTSGEPARSDTRSVSGGPVSLDSPAEPDQAPPGIGLPEAGLQNDSVVLVSEPMIRVGLFKTEQPVEFKSSFAYVLRDANGLILYELPTSTQAVLHYKKGQYTFYAQGTTLTSEAQFRLEAKGEGGYFELMNHEDRPKWNLNINYNQFRGAFELRYSKENDRVWAVNELPMEQYLAGLAEVSENKVPEFYKAQAVAARTYAYYQLQDGRKHASRNFDVNASQGDQVYAGYVREQTFKNGAEGVAATRGEMMTYNKDVVVTPYFAQSDGKTRTWKQAWGGSDKPWLTSVVAHYDKGRIKYGHGVGMSQYDAAKRAEKEGLDYKTLLKYYYQGVKIERVFK